MAVPHTELRVDFRLEHCVNHDLRPGDTLLTDSVNLIRELIETNKHQQALLVEAREMLWDIHRKAGTLQQLTLIGDLLRRLGEATR